MTYDQFIASLAMGSVSLLSLIMGWAIREIVKQGRALGVVVTSIDELKRRADSCDLERKTITDSLTTMVASIATLVERTYHQTKSLERIESRTGPSDG